MNDTERLDFLQALLFGKVICRDSTMGRGFRLHQTRSKKHEPFDSVRDAIDAYHHEVKDYKNYKDPDRCDCEKPDAIESMVDFCNKCKRFL